MGALQAGQNTSFRLDSSLGIFQKVEKKQEGAETKALSKTMAGAAPGCGYTHQQQQADMERCHSVIQALQRAKLRVNINPT